VAYGFCEGGGLVVCGLGMVVVLKVSKVSGFVGRE